MGPFFISGEVDITNIISGRPIPWLELKQAAKLLPQQIKQNTVLIFTLKSALQAAKKAVLVAFTLTVN
jgi:hypothetical protein